MSENLQDFPVFALAFSKRLSQLLQKALGETCWSFHERFGSSCCQSLTKKEQFMNVNQKLFSWCPVFPLECLSEQQFIMFRRHHQSCCH